MDYFSGQCCVNCGAAACSNTKCIRNAITWLQIKWIYIYNVSRYQLFLLKSRYKRCLLSTCFRGSELLTERMVANLFPAPRVLKRQPPRFKRIPSTGRGCLQLLWSTTDVHLQQFIEIIHFPSLKNGNEFVWAYNFLLLPHKHILEAVFLRFWDCTVLVATASTSNPLLVNHKC